MSFTSKLCRTCFKNSSCYTHIYEDFFFTGCLVYEVINELCQLEVNLNDGFSEYLCQECYLKIRDFKKFKMYAHRVKNNIESIREEMLQRWQRERHFTEVKKERHSAPEKEDTSNNLSQYYNEPKEDGIIGDPLEIEALCNLSLSVALSFCHKHPCHKANKEALEECGSLNTQNGDSSDSEVQIVTEIAVNASPALKHTLNYEKDLGVKSLKSEKLDKQQGDRETQEHHGTLDTKDGDSSESEVQFVTEVAVNASPARKNTSNYTKDFGINSPKKKTVQLGNKQGRSSEEKRKLKDFCTCPLCSQCFRKGEEIVSHLKIIHKKKYVCHICAVHVTNNYDLMKHLSKCIKTKRKILKKNEKAKKKPSLCLELPCDICGKCFFSRKSFRQHKLSHGLQFSCKTCGKKFRHEKQLNNHNCIHLQVHAVNFSLESLAERISASLRTKSCKVVHDDKRASNIEKNVSNVHNSSYLDIPHVNLNQPDPDGQESAVSDSCAQFKNNITPTDRDLHMFDINEPGFSRRLDRKNIDIDQSRLDIERTAVSNSIRLEVSNVADSPPNNGEVSETGLSNTSSDKRHGIAKDNFHEHYTDFIQANPDASSASKNNLISPKIEPRFHCDDCGEKFFIRANLVYHRKIHAGLNLVHSIPISSKKATKQKKEKYNLRKKKTANKKTRTNGEKPTDGKKQMHKKKDKVKVEAKSDSFEKEPNIEENANFPTEPTYGCDLCQKKFLFSSTVEAHRLYHEKLKNERPVTCDVCGTVPGGITLYLRHMKTYKGRCKKMLSKSKNPSYVGDDTSKSRGYLIPKQYPKNKVLAELDNDASIATSDLDSIRFGKNKKSVDINGEALVIASDSDLRGYSKTINNADLDQETSVGSCKLDPRSCAEIKNLVGAEHDQSIDCEDLESHHSLVPAVYESSYSGILGE